jgi:hypothetical protein
MIRKFILAAGVVLALLAPAYAADPQTFKTEDSATRAVDLFAPQAEPARTVADAAMTACSTEGAQYMIAFGLSHTESLEGTTRPRLIARVMAIRAARTGTGG